MKRVRFTNLFIAPGQSLYREHLRPLQDKTRENPSRIVFHDLFIPSHNSADPDPSLTCYLEGNSMFASPARFPTGIRARYVNHFAFSSQGLDSGHYVSKVEGCSLDSQLLTWINVTGRSPQSPL